MTVQTPHQSNILANHDLTPRDDAKKIVSEILKRVDQLIKKNNLELAMSEIQNAKEVDPRNVYTLALEERINVLLSAEHKRNSEQPAKNPMLPEPLPVQQPAAETPLPHSAAATVSSTPVQPLPSVTAMGDYRKILVEALESWEDHFRKRYVHAPSSRALEH